MMVNIKLKYLHSILPGLLVCIVLVSLPLAQSHAQNNFQTVLQDKVEQLEQRVDRLESEVKRLRSGLQKPRLTKTSKKRSALDTVTVCQQHCEYNDVAKAVKAVKKNGTVYLLAGINRSCAVINKPLNLIGKTSKTGERPHLLGGVCQNKGPLVINSSGVLIENLEVSHINVSHKNGACIRLGPKALGITVRKLYCHDSQNGILAKTQGGEILIEDSIFERNGFNNGQSHGLYLDSMGQITLRRVQIISTKNAGQTLKITAPKMLIENSALLALNGVNSRAIDDFGGGELVVRNSVLQQGPHSENHEMIGVALEKKRVLPGKHSVLLENNWIIFDNQRKSVFLEKNIGVLFRARKKGQYVVKNNWIVGMKSINLDGTIMEGNQLFNNREEAGLPPYTGKLNSFPVDN